ncbi:hypothetical protein D3C71_1169090 [compost metagenome]
MQVAGNGATLVFLQREQAAGHGLQFGIAGGQRIAPAFQLTEVMNHEQSAGQPVVNHRAEADRRIERGSIGTLQLHRHGGRNAVAIVVANRSEQNAADVAQFRRAQHRRRRRIGVMHSLGTDDHQPIDQGRAQLLDKMHGLIIRARRRTVCACAPPMPQASQGRYQQQPDGDHTPAHSDASVSFAKTVITTSPPNRETVGAREVSATSFNPRDSRAGAGAGSGVAEPASMRA